MQKCQEELIIYYSQYYCQKSFRQGGRLQIGKFFPKAILSNRKQKLARQVFAPRKKKNDILEEEISAVD